MKERSRLLSKDAAHVTPKRWGTTQRIFMNGNVQVERIQVKPEGYCSLHKHEFKTNMFYVEVGVLYVEVEGQDTVALKRGDSLIVSPGVLHRFRARNAVTAYEIYWVDLAAEDIVREG